MSNSLVEGLEVFERGFVFVRRNRAEVLIDTLMGFTPSIGLLSAQLEGEIFTQERMRIERGECARCVAIYCEHLASSRRLKLMLRCASLNPTSGSVRPVMAGSLEQCGETVGSNRAVEEAEQPQNRKCTLAFVTFVLDACS